MAAGSGRPSRRRSRRWARMRRSAPALLGIYLNDHLAAATAAVELANRAAAGSRDERISEPLARFAAEAAQDRAALLGLMNALGVRVRQYKIYAARVGEKAARLKLNGHLTGRSSLSTLEEVEVLQMGVTGKTAGWQTLRGLAEHDHRLDRAHLDQLISAADRQSHILEELRLRAAAAVSRSGAP
jgi:hypothetical protein